MIPRQNKSVKREPQALYRQKSDMQILMYRTGCIFCFLMSLQTLSKSLKKAAKLAVMTQVEGRRNSPQPFHMHKGKV